MSKDQLQMITEHPKLADKVKQLTAQVNTLTKDKDKAEADAAKFEMLYNQAKTGLDDKVEIAVLKAKNQAGLLMLQKAEAVAAAAAGAGVGTPGPAGTPGVPTPQTSALQQFFAPS